MFPVVMSKAYGEREAMMELTNAWEMLGGKACNGICAYVEDTTEFAMNSKLKEVLLGILYSALTILFIIGLLPWDLVSRIVACVIAMLAIMRIRKRKNNNENVSYFTISYMAVIVIFILLFNSISIGA